MIQMACNCVMDFESKLMLLSCQYLRTLSWFLPVLSWLDVMQVLQLIPLDVVFVLEMKLSKFEQLNADPRLYS